jgi:hypothetical protein
VPLTDPKVGQSEKFTDHFKEGERFYLTGIRTVKVNTQDYGEGDMVLLTVQGIDPELGIWGKYLTAQAQAAESSDLNKWYVVNRRMVPGFGPRAVKVLDPHAAPGQDEEDAPF